MAENSAGDQCHPQIAPGGGRIHTAGDDAHWAIAGDDGIGFPHDATLHQFNPHQHALGFFQLLLQQHIAPDEGFVETDGKGQARF